MLVRLDLRQFVDHAPRQIAFFEIEHRVVPEQKPPLRFLDSWFSVLVFLLVELPENGHRALPALANASAKLIGLFKHQP